MTRTKTSKPRFAHLKLPEESPFLEVARAVSLAGGRALVVGGWVRDGLLGRDQRDLDIEVHGLSPGALEALLARFGGVVQVGRAFAVLRIRGLDAEFSLPRRGPRGPVDPEIGVAEAARRRDLRINSMAWDPLTEELIDPHGGLDDLARCRLRATDPRTFAADPLRGLRVAGLIARLQMHPDAELVQLCAKLDLSPLAPERIFEELRRLLLLPERPSLGFEFLRETTLLRFFPELRDLHEVPQDPRWHPEGSVWVHTLMVLDEAARLRCDDSSQDAALMWAALCHDLGKAQTTRVEAQRIISPGHSDLGADLCRALLSRLRAPAALVEAAASLVRHHLVPRALVRDGARARAYRRLSRRLEGAGVALELLARLARADQLGRICEAARAGRFPAGDVFLERARQYGVERIAPPAAVRGRDLLARGLAPGPEIGRLLRKCQHVQDETGWTDVARILGRVLGGRR